MTHLSAQLPLTDDRCRHGGYRNNPSLLGALYLRIEALATAPAQDVRRCLWCNRIVDVREYEPPLADAPKRARGKHRTHKNRKFCKKTNGIRNACKNAFNYAQRKAAKGVF